MSNIHVIKVGGSMLSLSEDIIFDFNRAEGLKAALEKDNNKYVLCIGGGYLCRKYQELLREHGVGTMEQHNIGVASINMNAVMVHSVFSKEAEEKVLRYEDYDKDTSIEFDKKFLVTAAGSPGHSSDWNTVKLALRTGSKTIVSLKNVDGVYTADPKKDPDAKRLDKISWDDYMNIIGNPETHQPGANLPVDIFAAKLSKENGIKFLIISGNDFDNMRKAVNGESFIGTTIS